MKNKNHAGDGEVGEEEDDDAIACRIWRNPSGRLPNLHLIPRARRLALNRLSILQMDSS